MTETEIEAFLAVVNTGTISAAAEGLYITQPALSRRIHALEEQLGYKLFIRSKGVRAIELTEEGKAFVGLAKKWQMLFSESKGLTEALDYKHDLNFGIIGSMCTYLTPSSFDKFIKKYPECHMNIHQYHSEECYQHMENGSLHFAMVGKEMFSKTITTLPICRASFKLICSRKLSQGILHPSNLEVSKEIFVPWNSEFSIWHDYWFGNTARPRIWLDMVSLLEHFVTDRDAWSVVPSYIASHLVQQYGLYCYELQEAPAPMLLYALHPKGQLGDYAQKFLQVLKEELRDNKDLILLL